MGPQQSSSPLIPLFFQSRFPLRCAPSIGLCHNVGTFSLLRRDPGVAKNSPEWCNVMCRCSLPLTEEATMVAIPKIVSVMSCGVLLCLGLSGNAVSAADVMKAGQAGERIGGQAGQGYEQGKQQHVAAPQVSERIGGQAGLNEMEGMGK